MDNRTQAAEVAKDILVVMVEKGLVSATSDADETQKKLCDLYEAMYKRVFSILASN